MPADRDFTSLRAFLGRVPAIEESMKLMMMTMIERPA